MADKKVTGWFTMNGKHIPVFEGESKKDAVKRSISNGKAHQPVSKGHTEKKWKEFEDASRKAEIMHADIDAPKYRKKEIDKAREYDKAVEQKRKNGEIKSVKINKKSVASKNEDIKAKQIAQAKEQADKASGKVIKDIKNAYGYTDEMDGFKSGQKLILGDSFTDNNARFLPNENGTSAKLVRLETKDAFGNSDKAAVIEYKNAKGKLEQKRVSLPFLNKMLKKQTDSANEKKSGDFNKEPSKDSSDKDYYIHGNSKYSLSKSGKDVYLIVGSKDGKGQAFKYKVAYAKNPEKARANLGGIGSMAYLNFKDHPELAKLLKKL